MMKADFQGKYTLIPANPGWFVLHFHSVNQAGTLTHPHYSKEEVICWAIDDVGARFPISYEKNYAGQNKIIFVISPSGAVLSSHGNKWKNIEDWMKTEFQKIS